MILLVLLTHVNLYIVVLFLKIMQKRLMDIIYKCCLWLVAVLYDIILKLNSLYSKIIFIFCFTEFIQTAFARLCVYWRK